MTLWSGGRQSIMAEKGMAAGPRDSGQVASAVRKQREAAAAAALLTASFLFRTRRA